MYFFAKFTMFNVNFHKTANLTQCACVVAKKKKKKKKSQQRKQKVKLKSLVNNLILKNTLTIYKMKHIL